MEAQAFASSSLCTEVDEKNLKQLLEAFGSVVSLKDIASAYCETGRNLNSTAEILCNMQGSTSGTCSSKSQNNAENTSSPSSSSSSVCPSNNISENVDIGKTKPKKGSASMGTVSDVIGKDYIRPKSQSNGLNEKSKPVIINSDDIPVSEIWDEKPELDSGSQSESMDSDLEEFLFKMLGKGFQLDKSVIQDVIGQCGYNMSRSIDKLLDMSVQTLEKSDDVIGVGAGNAKPSSSRRLDTNVENGGELILPRAETKTKDVQREVLESLFSVPDRFEEKEVTPIRPVRRSPHGQIVTKPPDDIIIEDFTFITRQLVNHRNDDENQMSYDDMRKALTEYWASMKESFKAALDAYIKKDYENAYRLKEEGNYYMMKARETDEKSAQKLINNRDEDEEFSIKMHHLEPKEALYILKFQLTSLSGLPTIRYLKFAVGTNTGDQKDKRRKRLITKLLEKEGIPWTEEGNGLIISVRADEIDPSKLSFAKK
ncbi:hypothetical protein ABFS82_13G077700 [Erythranthe guttata]